jgi:hypothetical protein
MSTRMITRLNTLSTGRPDGVPNALVFRDSDGEVEVPDGDEEPIHPAEVDALPAVPMALAPVPAEYPHIVLVVAKKQSRNTTCP